MVRAEGIEPSPQAWEAHVLPLNYARSIKPASEPSPAHFAIRLSDLIPLLPIAAAATPNAPERSRPRARGSELGQRVESLPGIWTGPTGSFADVLEGMGRSWSVGIVEW